MIRTIHLLTPINRAFSLLRLNYLIYTPQFATTKEECTMDHRIMKKKVCDIKDRYTLAQVVYCIKMSTSDT